MTGGQVRTLVWSTGTLAVLAVTSPVEAVTGQELLRQCEALERVYGHRAGPCRNRGRRGRPVSDRLLCPAEATRIELVRAFTKYARAHREGLDLRATALVIPALSAAFPCRERRAASEQQQG
jgi:hypothetical protein